MGDKKEEAAKNLQDQGGDPTKQLHLVDLGEVASDKAVFISTGKFEILVQKVTPKKELHLVDLGEIESGKALAISTGKFEIVLRPRAQK